MMLDSLGFPLSDPSKQCIAMNTNRQVDEFVKTWQNVDCNQRKSFVCKARSLCSQLWVYSTVGDMCYLFDVSDCFDLS